MHYSHIPNVQLNALEHASPVKRKSLKTIINLNFDKLTFFSLLWGIASLIHILSFSDRLTSSNPGIWLALVLSCALILFPGSIWLFMGLIFCRIIDYIYWMPFTPNHLLFEFIININILVSLIYKLFLVDNKSKLASVTVNNSAWRDAAFDFFRPPIAISLGILYFFAVFHKLNFDYVNPAISCSTYLMEHFTSGIPALNNNIFIRMGAVWGTLLFEGGIPLLLCFKQTRRAGILIGLVFHFILAFHPHRGIYSFSALIFSLYFLFVPDTFLSDVSAAGKRLFGQYWRQLTGFLTLSRFIFPVSILLLVVAFSRTWYRLFVMGYFLWLILGILLIALFAIGLIFFQGPRIYQQKIFSLPLKVMWVFPVIVFLNGLNPYFGFKTQTSFSMFSNLRTEGNITNHLFVPLSLQSSTLQTDLIDIISSDAAELKIHHQNNQLITFFEFRRITSSLKKDFYVRYKRNGKLQELQVQNGKSNQPELLTPHPWLASKLLAFRPIDKGSCLCKH